MTGTVACDFRMARAERLEGCVEGVDLVRAWIVRKEMPEDSRRVIRSVVCCWGVISFYVEKGGCVCGGEGEIKGV